MLYIAYKEVRTRRMWKSVENVDEYIECDLSLLNRSETIISNWKLEIKAENKKIDRMGGTRWQRRMEEGEREMKDKLKTIEYFKSCLLEPSEIFEILNNPSHEQYNNLIFDLNHLDKFSLEEYVKEYNIDRYLNRFENKDQGRRIFYLLNLLREEIAKERISALLINHQDPNHIILKI